MIICMDCQIEMRVKKNGRPLESMAHFGAYQLFMSDEYECPGCGKLVAFIDRTQKPVAEHYEPSYRRTRESLETKQYPIARFWASLNDKGAA